MSANNEGMAGLRRRHLLASAGALGLAGPWAWAKAPYPDRPITMVVPYTAGGSTDLVARLVTQKMGEGLKQAFVVDNKAGANGIIGMEAALRSKADGYTLLMNTAGAQTLAPLIYKTRIDGIDDWMPISLISTIPFALVVKEDLPAKNFQEFVQLAKKADKPLTASSGSSMIVLITEALKSALAAPHIINAQYKGTALQAQAVIKGEVDFTVDSMVTLPQIKAGKVRALAVFGDHRVSSLPDVPTFKELGIAGMNFSSWSAMLAPKGTPQEIVDLLEKEARRVVQLPEMQARLSSMDHVPVGSTAKELEKTIRDDIARWKQVVKDTNFKIDGAG